MTKNSLPATPPDAVEVYIIRGEQVVLDSRVASGFGVETKRINEAVARNPAKFNEAHCFELSVNEFASLKSQAATSNSGRGGRRYPPRVYTAKGVARLATILNTDQALQTSDLIIDTFIAVQKQIASGSSQVEIPSPSRYRPSADPQAARKITEKLSKALTSLLDIVIDTQTNQTVRETAFELGSGALAHVRERLRAQGLENTKLEADTALVLAQAEKVAAEVRHTHAQTDGVTLDNLQKRIDIVRQIAAIHREMEAPEVIQLLGAFDAGGAIMIPDTRQLPGPVAKNTKDSK
jgi:hypothetical protein